MSFKSFKLAVGLSVSSLLVAGAAVASDYQAIEDRLAGLLQDTSQVVISETPVAGLVQVRIGGDIVYLSDDGRYLLQGNIVDMDTQVNLTDAALSDVRKEQLAALDAEQFVTFGNSDSEFEVLVFTDPDCGFCRRMHDQMDGYQEAGITVHYVAYPRAGVGSPTYDKLVSVWCAEDRNGAMDIAKEGRTPPRATCDNPVTEQFQLGQAMGVTGTPSIMTFDGDIIPGYVPPEQLRERLKTLAARNGQ